uniref:Thioredoxin-like fold domain-containing protein n=1 Tax=Kalanchoe fedtschenkoi TaxID=63787 RepID=A0A7N0U4F0_KALFE
MQTEVRHRGWWVFFFSVLLSGSINAIVPIPAKLDGFPYGTKPFNPGAIVIDAFFDPVCPDSRDAWPPLKQALQRYGSRVALTLHPFPLPYHDNAFATSRALHIVNGLNKSATFDMLEAFFSHQEKFYNLNTKSKSKDDIVDELVVFVSDVAGKPYLPSIKSAFQDRKTDLLTRVSFKYSCSRGVAETPFFLINGFQLASNDQIDYEGWRRILDPLIKKQSAEYPLTAK